MADAATNSVGVVVELVTVGTNHAGQSAVLATKFVTEPPPDPEPVKVQVVPEQEPAPALKLKVYAPAVELIEVTPEAAEEAKVIWPAPLSVKVMPVPALRFNSPWLAFVVPLVCRVMLIGIGA
jgi:hypothetical protein